MGRIGAFGVRGGMLLGLVAEGDKVASFLSMSGTNTGDYRRGGATHKKGNDAGVLSLARRRRAFGRGLGHGGLFQFLQQLGVVPSDDELAARTPKDG
jgi:hypothetical protein